MGTLSRGPISDFVRDLAPREGLADFVETGTYLGGTTRWAADVFSRVFTVDISPKFQDKAKTLCAGRDNISWLVGRSEERLPEILAALAGPAVFWLDAHAGGGYFAPVDDCPLIEELRLIAARGVVDDIILIDDARGFTAPPPPPFNADAWPPLHAVFEAADPRHERYIVIIADVIVCVPPRLRAAVVALCNEVRPKI